VIFNAVPKQGAMETLNKGVSIISAQPTACTSLLDGYGFWDIRGFEQSLIDGEGKNVSLRLAFLS